MASKLSLDDFSESEISEEELLKQRKVAKQAQKSPSEKPKVQSDPSKPAIGRHIYTSGGIVIIPPVNSTSKAFERKKEEAVEEYPFLDLEMQIAKRLGGKARAETQKLLRTGKLRIIRSKKNPVWRNFGYVPVLRDQLKFGTALDAYKLRIEHKILLSAGRHTFLPNELIEVKIFMGDRLPGYPPYFDRGEGAWNPLRAGRLDWCSLDYLEDNWELLKDKEMNMNPIDEITGKYRSYYEVVVIPIYILDQPHFWYYDKWEHDEAYLAHVHL